MILFLIEITIYYNKSVTIAESISTITSPTVSQSSTSF
jgi:hypothetical protein